MQSPSQKCKSLLNLWLWLCCPTAALVSRQPRLRRRFVRGCGINERHLKSAHGQVVVSLILSSVLANPLQSPVALLLIRLTTSMMRVCLQCSGSGSGSGSCPATCSASYAACVLCVYLHIAGVLFAFLGHRLFCKYLPLRFAFCLFMFIKI